MHKTLLEELMENGYVVIEDFLTPEETEELYKSGRTLCMEAPKSDRIIFSTVNSEKQQSKEKYFLESGNKVRYFFEEGAIGENEELLVDPMCALNKVGHALHVENESFKKISFSNRVKEICWQLNYRRPAICQSMYIYKHPGIGGEVTPHQDAWYLHTEPSTAIGFWFALEDTTLQNGCLQFIKGSHKGGIHRRFIRNPDLKSNELLIYDKPAPIYPISNFTPVTVRKGTCIIIHGQVVHKSDHNRSNKSRHAYTFHVIETDNTKYSEDNWLQPPKDEPFPVLYERTDLLRLALLQLKVSKDKVSNVQNALAKIAQVVEDSKPRIVALSECFNSPYGTNYFREYSETIPNGDTCKALSQSAKQHRIYIIGGTIPEKGEDDAIYNTCTIWDPKGNLIGKHRKVHLFDIDIPGGIRFKESETLSAGDQFTIVEFDGHKVGIGICYDIRFEEMARIYRNSGCEMLIYPAAFNMTTGPMHWELLQRSRANDNQLFVATISPSRDENAGYVAYGHSMVVDPWAQILASAKENEEIVIADLDFSLVEKVRQQIPISIQRRTDLYSTETKV